MRQRLLPLFTTWPFLLALALLMANDLWIKAAWPGLVTGKLSDFAGIAVVGMLLSAAWPKRGWAIFMGVSVFFLWWKSPLSTAFISWWNTLGLMQLVRVVDFTDLVALVVLPVFHRFAGRVPPLPGSWQPRSLSDLESVGCKSTAAVHFSPSFCPIAGLWACKSGKNCPRWGRFSLSTFQVRQAPRFRHRARRWLTVPMVGLTLAGLLGTSSPNLYSGYQVRKQVADEPLQREIVADVVKAVAERNGLVCHDCRRRTQTAFYVGKVDLSYEFVSDTAVDFSMRWHPTGLFISGGESELAERIRGELKRTLGERLNGLEYVESLDANQRGLRMIRPATPQPAGAGAGSGPAGKAPASAASAPVRR